MREAVRVSGDNPVLIDRYLNDAIEVDVDCIADHETVYVAGVMEHIEEAGIHSGDSACSLPPYTLPPATVTELKAETEAMAKALGVVGLMNVQYAIKDDVIFVLEVNPRASRTVPFVAKATGVAVAKIGARVMKEFCSAIASISSGKGFLSVILIVLSSATPQASTTFAAVWPNVSLAAQRARLGAQSCARTGSPSWPSSSPWPPSVFRV